MDLTESSASPRRHPWELARQRFFAREVTNLGLRSQPRQVLDVGAGDGFFSRKLLELLPAGSSAVLWDAFYNDGQLAHSRPGFQLTRERPRGQFDVLCLLDVLEHIESDEAFLRDIVDANAVPGAWVLVSVPAWPALFTKHDTFLRHFRRYTPRQCRRLLEAAGLTVMKSGGLFHSLLLPRALAKVRELAIGPEAPRAASAGEWQFGSTISGCVEAALRLDNRLSRVMAGRQLEIPGLSWWALCRK